VRAPIRRVGVPMIVEAVNHVCFTVSDLECSVRFWARFLGTGPERRVDYNGPTDEAVTGYPGAHFLAAYFRLPGDVLLELFEYVEPPPERPSSSETYVVGNAHLGITVDDLDEAHQRLQGTGATFRSPGPVPVTSGRHAGARSMYVRDPDGITIEVLELPPPPEAGRSA
jgi:catechol 2,3-dioxygenase-like lactoylglutathione lyase family enzyme